jgi:hypothetical protein
MHKPPAACRVHRHPDLLFWGCFLFLNGLLFLPLYLMNASETALFPHEWTNWQNLRQFAASLLLWRENTDPFRLNVELAVLLALWVNTTWLRRGAVRWLVMALYFVAFAYYLYEGIMVSLYRDEPVFYNHYFLIKDGLAFLLDHLHLSLWVYLLTGVGIAALVALLIWAVRVLTDGGIPSQMSRASRVTIAALAVAVAATALAYRGVLADPRMVVSSLAFKLERNISASYTLYQNLAQFDDAEIRAAYDYSSHTLERKPNIYIIFIESYGSVLYKRDDWRVAYIELLDKVENTLLANGFQVASALSASPTWGGGSWLAYTSAIFGMRIDNHPQYLTLMDRYQQENPRYPDFGAYLRGQGYFYQWVTSLSVELRDSVWDKYSRFYGVDQWLRYRDLDYQGLHYGWGPAPSDQYVLGYAVDQALKAVDQPRVVFYITQNSHYPWDPLPPLVEDWRTLGLPTDQAEVPPAEGLSHPEIRQNYFDAIDYSLNMLAQYIIDRANEDAVFILIGDHQPPRVSRRADGYETPVHIITRDPEFVGNLVPHGFERTMRVYREQPIMRHEGLYSLLARTLAETYGTHPDAAPEFMPEGVMPPDWISSVEDTQ